MAEATTLREKEAAAYEKENSEDTANLAAVDKASVAIEKGMGGAFLQTSTANVLRHLAEKRQEQELVAFLSATDSYAPASGEITGILKTMSDEMAKDIADQNAAEKAAIAAYDRDEPFRSVPFRSRNNSFQEKIVPFRSGDKSVPRNPFRSVP